MYAVNNPLKFVDPDGRDALLVTKADGSQVILMPIRFSGAAASTALVDGIVARTNGLATPTPNLSIRVVRTNKPIGGVLNEVTVGLGPRAMCGDTGSCASERSAHINGTGILPEATGAHEIMHLAGTGDHYNRDGTGKSGYEKSITGTLNGTEVTSADITEAKASGRIKRTVVCSAGTSDQNASRRHGGQVRGERVDALSGLWMCKSLV